MANPIADALAACDIPFVFTTGYDALIAPARLAGMETLQEAGAPMRSALALFG
jgi:hypothetical protein